MWISQLVYSLNHFPCQQLALKKFSVITRSSIYRPIRLLIAGIKVPIRTNGGLTGYSIADAGYQ